MSESESLLTMRELKDWLDYDSSIGVFTARLPRLHVVVGKPVGWLDDHGYTRIILNGKRLLAHRLAWFWCHGVWPADEIDHINGDRNDNRICNLREATNLQNCHSKKPHTDATSGYKGVTKAKRRGVWSGWWHAQICFKRQIIHLGYFRDPILAARAYDAAAQRLFGEFAKTNANMGLLECVSP